METKEFIEWKKWYKKIEPEAYSILSDKDIYELYLMNEKIKNDKIN